MNYRARKRYKYSAQHYQSDFDMECLPTVPPIVLQWRSAVAGEALMQPKRLTAICNYLECLLFTVTA